jgi:hypothetical protein
VADDPEESRRVVAEAVAAFEALGLRIDAARAMVDLARAMLRLGEDARPTLEGARAILVDCDAVGFLFEVDAALIAGT